MDSSTVNYISNTTKHCLALCCFAISTFLPSVLDTQDLIKARVCHEIIEVWLAFKHALTTFLNYTALLWGAKIFHIGFHIFFFRDSASKSALSCFISVTKVNNAPKLTHHEITITYDYASRLRTRNQLWSTLFFFFFAIQPFFTHFFLYCSTLIWTLTKAVIF